MDLECYTTDELLGELRRRRDQLEREIGQAAKFDDGLKVREIRKKLKLNLAEFAKMTGYTPSMLSMIENGQRSGDRLLKLLRTRTA